MGLIFKDDWLDGFGSWALGYIPFGGIDFGEIQGVALATGDGDGTAYYNAWIVAGDRFFSEADMALQSNQRTVAKELFLKASEMLCNILSSNLRLPC